MADDDKVYTQEEVDALVAEKIGESETGLKANRDEALREAKTAKKALKAYEGLDPEEIREMQTKLAALEHERKAKKAGLTSEELDRLRKEVRDDLDKEYGPLKSQNADLAQDLRALRLDSVVKAIMGKNGVRGERVDALFRLTSAEYDLTEDGKPMLKDRKGTPVEKYVTEDLSKEYPEFFDGTGSSGGGASKSTAGSGGKTTIAADDNAAFIANLPGIAAGTVEVK